MCVCGKYMELLVPAWYSSQCFLYSAGALEETRRREPRVPTPDTLSWLLSTPVVVLSIYAERQAC